MLDKIQLHGGDPSLLSSSAPQELVLASDIQIYLILVTDCCTTLGLLLYHCRSESNMIYSPGFPESPWIILLFGTRGLSEKVSVEVLSLPSLAEWQNYLVGNFKVNSSKSAYRL